MVAQDIGVRFEELENDWQTGCVTVSWEHVGHVKL